MADPLLEEAEAFAKHARERQSHGHIPDLRDVQPCDWFYNNPWRRPYLVEMIFGRYFKFAISHLVGKRVLEVGSGVGHMTLEFARNGYDVTGVELSPGAVELAKQTSAANRHTDGFGSLSYVASDFLSWPTDSKFDNICFFGALHHFDEIEPVVEKASALLTPDGRVIVIEPARDWFNSHDGAIVALIRLLLSAQGSWHEQLEVPSTEAQFAAYAEECKREYIEARDKNEAEQSPHDNDAYATEMLEALRKTFAEIDYQPGFSFLPRMAGGVRANEPEREKRLAEFLRVFDRYAVDSGLMNPNGFLWAGR